MSKQVVPHVPSSSATAPQRHGTAISTLSARKRTNTLTTGFLLIALFQLLCCATTPAEAQTTTTTAATTTKVTVNGKVFYVFVPTDRGQTVTLPSARSDATLGGIAVLGATIDVDEGGNSNVGGGTVDKPASGNGAPSRSFSLLTSSLALSATFGGLIWTIADLGLL